MQLDMHVVVWTCDFFACGVSGGVLCVTCTHSIHSPYYNGCLLHTVMCLWYFVSHGMHATPSSLQVVTLPSAVEAGLSKCTTLQKLTVRGRLSPPSVTAALLKAVTVIRSLEEVTLDVCDFGMYVVCVCVCVCVCV